MRRRITLTAAAVAAGAMMLTNISPAMADEASPSPSPSSDLRSPTVTAGQPLQASVGQSLQIRTTADGNANSGFGMLRWAATQVTVTGEGSGNVPVPMEGSMFRSLDGFSAPAMDNGVANFEFTDVPGWDEGRTLDLYPMDAGMALEVSTKFTLDGQEVTADQIVGKSGVVTAEYTVKNNTARTIPTTFNTILGETETRDVVADQPFVVQAQTVLPQRFTGLNAGIGQVGADGMGGNQVMWIALPFRPLSSDGTASFGWAANVTNGEIPSMVIQAAPLYLPPSTGDSTEEASDDSGSGGGLGLGLGGASIGGNANFAGNAKTAAAGAKDLISGIKASVGVIGTSVGEAGEGTVTGIRDVAAAVEQICSPELLDCANSDIGGIVELVDNAVTGLEDAQTNLYDLANQFESQGADVPALIDGLNDVNNWLGEVKTAMTAAQAGLNNAKTALTEAQSYLQSSNTLLQNALTFCESAENPTPGAINGTACSAYQTQITNNNKLLTAGGSTRNFETIPDALASVNSGLSAISSYLGLFGEFSVLQTKISVAVKLLPSLLGSEVAGVINDIADALTTPINGLVNVQTLIQGLKAPMADLAAGFGEIAAAITGGLSNLANLRNTVPAIISGAGELKGGLGGLGADTMGVLGEIVSLALTAKSKLVTVVDGVVTEVNALGARANDLKAQVVALELAAQQSPLPYASLQMAQAEADGNPAQGQTANTLGTVTPISSAVAATDAAAGTIPTTQVFGAYQFMMDPANENTMQTRSRIMLGIFLLIIAAGAGWALSRRRSHMS